MINAYIIDNFSYDISMKKFDKAKDNKIQELVKIVKSSDKNNDDAFCELFNYFKPLIRSLQLIYKIDDFDYDDWIQEGAIVCYKACISYNGSRGSRFASYYRLLLKNHIISLIRKQETAKRKINKKKPLLP
ncbi:sigma-70 family RNA polymerase sigma factor [Xylocopilactobacillus apis]|uniref:RNA polymerase sigma-70 region 2 domain-containing protein n=1 Tax=Xylocopilactobacillus apis TaxID=2932183 RepID=A0AAU9D4W1_9LACO|nr:sigma-70 family RNA polymerase sigma factor [Xylocopilactobacillus apis]BDR56440.1 hypothetical protein KIMC2_10020 [Xylocopilactobacillus apis]